MLSIRTLPQKFIQDFQGSLKWLHTAPGLLTKKDSSSSSSSSDSSDSDNEPKEKPSLKSRIKIDRKKQTQPISRTLKPEQNQKLNDLIFKLAKKSDNADVQNFKVAIDSHSVRFEELRKSRPTPQKSFEENIVTAAKDVAKSMDGDEDLTQYELLQRVLGTDKSKSPHDSETFPDKSKKPKELNELLGGMKVDQAPSKARQYIERKIEMARKARQENSMSRSILKEKSQQKTPTKRYLENVQTELKIFNLDFTPQENRVDLSTWEAMEQRQLKLAMIRPPENYFQEMILWTEEGRLWKFPIDNEQGLDSEAMVHFSEHVFLERYIRDWCPKKGPIRHFMELVCIGLSRNPYITVEQKRAHIAWYREYFASKRDLLRDTNAITPADYDKLKDFLPKEPRPDGVRPQELA